MSRWTCATCGEVRRTWNKSPRESADRVVRNVFSAVARQDEFPIFLRTEGQATQVVVITMDTTLGHLQRIVLDLWGIPTDRQRIVNPSTLRALQVHDALGHYNITKDATLYVFPRAQGGMNASTAHQHWHMLTARDPSTGPGFMQHVTPKRANPLHAMGSPPPPPPVPTRARDSTNSASSNLQQKVQYHLKQGKSSLYHWESHDTPPGLQLGNQFFHDEKQVCPRQEMVQAMASIQQWTVELSDGVSTPNTGLYVW